MKKLVALTLTLVLLAASCLIFASCGDNNGKENNGKFTVGICQLVQHPALDQATKGFKDALVAELGAENVVFDEQNASGDTNVCSTIVNKFVNNKVDLIMANATPALGAAYNATATIPILGTSITEYGVALGTTLNNGVVGGNVSGTSDLAPLDQQVDMIMELCPDVKNVGIVYCSAEANSKYQVEQVTRFLQDKGVTVKSFSFSDTNDLASVVASACAFSDAIYIPTDNAAADGAEIIATVVSQHNIPVFTGESNVAKVCGVASLSISYYDLGVTTGKMAAKILKGEADISTMPIEYAPATKMYNKEMCERLGIVVPEGYVEIK